MNIDFVRRLIEVLKENDLAEIEVGTLFRRVRISRAAAPGLTGFAPSSASPFPKEAITAAADETDIAVEEEKGSVEITSPMVGTFYRAASPDRDPYVEEGQFIEKGTVICIIEAMKIMNEIKSEYRGTIRKIKAENAEPVEYGQVLMTIKKG